MKFVEKLKERARQNPAKVVFPEGFDPRVLEAVGKIVKEKTAIPVLIGNKKELQKIADAKNIDVPWESIEVVDPDDSDYIERYSELLTELRADKGMTMGKARETLKNACYFATILLYHNEADAMIAGTTWSTADTMRPALQIIKSKEEFHHGSRRRLARRDKGRSNHKVSSYFLMIQEEEDGDPNNDIFLFADAAINIEPTSEELAGIAIDTAETAKRFGIEPKVAMLSFSTIGSGGDHPSVLKVKEAALLAKKKRPDLMIEGEMQIDTALAPEVCAKKFPNSKIKGRANVLIFPDLNSGNIAYKLVQRIGKYKALGPVMQGLAKPVNDLSRGCSVEDIVNMAAISSMEARALQYPWEHARRE